MSRWLFFIVLVACSARVAAHDTWLAPEPPTGSRSYWTVQLTTGNAFPALETAAEPERVERAELVTSSRRLPLIAMTANAHALPFRVVSDEDTVSVAVVAMRPYDIELTPELVETYVRDELGSDEQILARYRSQGRWRERFTKNAKALIRSGGAAPAAIAIQPHGLAYELVPTVDPTVVVAGESFQVCAYANGVPVRREQARVHVGLVEADSSSALHAADRNGCVRVRPRTTEGYLLHSILITPVDAGDIDWKSQFASLTVRRAAAPSFPMRSQP